MLDNISYALPVWPHSPCWPLLLRVAHLTSLPLTYVRTCARNAVLGIIGLLLVRVVSLTSFLADLCLVRVARLLSFSSLAYISYALHVWPHSPCRHTSRRRSSSSVILLAGQHLVRVARLASFSLLTYISWRSSSAVILLPAQNLVRIAHLASFSSLAFLSYALLVLPHSSH